MIVELDYENCTVYRKDILKCLSDGFGKTFVNEHDFIIFTSGNIGRMFLYVLNNKVVSVLTLIIEPKLIHNGYYIGHIEDVCTNNNYRNSGFSTELINYACSIAKDFGCYKVILDSKLDGFYEKLGFTVVEKCYRKDL